MGFWVALIVSLVLNVVSYLIMPKPKQSKPDAAKDMDDPTAEAGRPMPVVFGTMTVSGLNVLWFGQKSTRSYSVKA